MGQRAPVFAVALLVRCAIAFVFFGSVDVTNAILDAERLLRGALPSSLNVPYLPGVQGLIWAAALLSFHGWPVTFFYKVFGCIFDSAIAAMLTDARGSRAGWLYAFAPVPIFIVAIHGQWDSISLAFFIAGLLLLRRPGVGPAAGAGALYVLSVIVKPIALPFIVFFFPAPWLWGREVERKRVIAILAGITGCLGLYVLTLRALGDPLNYRTIEHILDYAGGGVTYLGLPHALGIGQNRMLLLLLPILILLSLYWKGRIGRETAILLGYTFILGTAGLSAQYLAWLVPFLLLRGHDRFLAIYSVLAGIYLTFFYTTPGIGAIRFENLAAMAPLRQLSWLTPAFNQIEAKTWASALVGNMLLPVSCLAFLTIIAWRRTPEPDADQPAPMGPLWAAGALTALLLLFALTLPRPDADAFVTRTHAKAAAYDMRRIAGPGEPHWAIRSYGAAHWARRVDAADLALLWIVSWSVVAAFGRRAVSRSAPSQLAP